MSTLSGTATDDAGSALTEDRPHADSETQVVTSVGRATIAGVVHWGSDTPLIGRTEETVRLASAIDRALAGTASATLIAGDAGVGKTRLLGEVMAQAKDRGLTVLLGHCVDVGDVGLPYLPFSEILGVLANDADLAYLLNEHPTAARLVRDNRAGESPESSSRLQLFAAVTSLLADLAAVRPVLIVIEDLHWADQSTRDLLRFMLSRIRTERLALLASYRADDLHRRHPLRPLLAELVRLPVVDRMTVDPMEDRDVASLLHALHPGSLSELDVRRIVSRAEGNAFYAEELLAADLDSALTPGRFADPGSGGSSTDASSAGGGLPSGLTDVLLSRLEQLPPTAQRVVRLASVAGRRVEHTLLRDAADLPDDELDLALREAIGRHLMMSEDGHTYSFRHALLREAAYGDLLPGERVRMHAVFARLMADWGDEWAAARAHHSRESHDLPEALSASLQAAAYAERIGAPTEQLGHLEIALELWSAVGDAEERAGHTDVVLMLRAAGAAAAAGEGTRAVALSRAALERVSPQVDAELAAKVRYTLAKNLISIDHERAAYQQSTAALELIPADPPSLTRVWAATTHILTSSYADDIEGARRAGAEALAGAKALGALDAQADVLISTVFLETDGRDTPAGCRMLEEAYDLARRSGNVPIELRALFNLAIGSHEAGRLDRALHWAEIGLERAAQTGMTWSAYALEMRHMAVLCKYAGGDWDGAVETASLSGVTVVELAQHVAASALYIMVGRGEPGVAERVESILGTASAQPMPAIIAGSVGIDEAMWRGDPVTAVRRFERVSTVIGQIWSSYSVAIVRLAALCLAAVADRLVQVRMSGDAAEAERWSAEAEKVITMAREVKDPRFGYQSYGIEAQAWSHRAEAEYARITGQDAVGAWRAALADFGFGDVYESARCGWRLAEALLAQDQLSDEHRAEAATHALAAHAEAKKLGATPLLRAVEALIRRGRLDVGREVEAAVSAGANGTVLTAREVDVLQLLARGHTNRQIGTSLYISAKTASVHVSNILAKLGVGSRAEAVTVAHRRGLLGADH